MKQSISNIITILFFIYISFYTALLVTPFFEQDPINPYQIIGPTTEQHYNPQNNTINYLVITTGTITLFYLLYYLNQTNKNHLINISIIFVIITSFALNQITTFESRVGNIDMFHDGEQLGTAALLKNFNKQPFSDVFFLHGYFADPGIALLSFNLFGTSIGSFYFLTIILTIVSFIILLVVLSIVIKDRYLFIITGFYLIAGSLAFSFHRDLLTFIIILLFYLISINKISTIKGTFFTTLLSTANFYISMDRAFYTFAANTLFVLLSLAFSTRPFNNLRIISALKIIVSSLGGLVTSLLTGLIYFGSNSFYQFIEITFVRIPQLKTYLDEYRFPDLSLSTLFPYWIPIFIIIGSFILCIYYTHKTKYNKLSIFLITLNFLALFYFRSGIGRSDLSHITYVFHIIIITIVITCHYINLEKSRVTKIMIYVFITLLLLLPYINYQKLLLPPKYTNDQIIQFITLFIVNDNRWINAEHQSVINFITKNSTQNDYIFVYTNESAYYYLLKRNNPTRFNTVWFASPIFYQHEVVNDLQENRPKFIIYNSDYWSNSIDNITNQKRLPIIEKWIIQNYKLEKTLGSTEIYSQK